MSPEELNLSMMKFESRTGGSSHYPKDSDLSFVEPEPHPEAGGYVLYEKTDEGWVATFQEASEPVKSSRLKAQRAILESELLWKGNLDDVSLPPGGVV